MIARPADVTLVAVFRGFALACVLLLAGCAGGPRRGLVVATQLPEGWTLHETEHYQVQTDASPAAAARLGRKLEKILALYREFLPSDRELPRFPVKFFRSYQDYLDYGGEEGSGGFYDESHLELVATRFENFTMEVDVPARPGSSGAKATRIVRVAMPQEKVDAALYHEAWHQYLHWAVDTDGEFPTWFDEGMGDYFGQAKPAREGFDLGRLHTDWVEALQEAIRAGRHVPLADFVRLSRDDYYDRPMVCYPEGWALVHFLRHSGNPLHLAVADRLLEVFLRTGKDVEAVDAAFRGIDLGVLEEEWKAYVLRWPVP
ncbi:MAG: DUF1570 domain-containing protein [Planctomycetes bacterium]|nr:DUF1570 domain-containing protein [Planctomycetota bacterium]